MSGDVVEGFRLKPAGGSKQFSDHLAKLQLAEVALQQTKPTVSACVYQAVDTPRLLNQQWAGAGLNRLNCWGIRSLPWINRISRASTSEADTPAEREKVRVRETPPSSLRYESVPRQYTTAAHAKSGR